MTKTTVLPVPADYGGLDSPPSGPSLRPPSGDLDRKATLALISGSIRGSSSTKPTLTITVALVRSAVGTIMWTLPAEAGLGHGVELNLAGLA